MEVGGIGQQDELINVLRAVEIQKCMKFIDVGKVIIAFVVVQIVAKHQDQIVRRRDLIFCRHFVGRHSIDGHMVLVCIGKIQIP